MPDWIPAFYPGCVTFSEEVLVCNEDWYLVMCVWFFNCFYILFFKLLFFLGNNGVKGTWFQVFQSSSMEFLCSVEHSCQMLTVLLLQLEALFHFFFRCQSPWAEWPASHKPHIPTSGDAVWRQDLLPCRPCWWRSKSSPYRGCGCTESCYTWWRVWSVQLLLCCTDSTCVD